jgi:aminopeptidase-like protein
MSTEEIASIKESLVRIETAIVGDPQMGNKGLAQRISEVENKNGDIERKLILWGGVITGISVTLTHLKTKILG